MNYKRYRLAHWLFGAGASLLGLGMILLLVKLLMVVAWFLALPLLAVGLIMLIAGWILR